MNMARKEVQHVIDTIQGKIPEDAVLQDMKAFFEEELSTKIYDYFCDAPKKGPHQVRFAAWNYGHRLLFSIENAIEPKEEKIKERFSRACREHGLHEMFFDTGNYSTDLVFVCDDVLKFLIRQNRSEIKTALKKHPEVKKFEISEKNIKIYYAKKMDVDTYSENGLTDRIKEEIGEILGTEDGFEEFPSGFATFTSLETLKNPEKVKPWFMQ